MAGQKVATKSAANAILNLADSDIQIERPLSIKEAVMDEIFHGFLEMEAERSIEYPTAISTEEKDQLAGKILIGGEQSIRIRHQGSREVVVLEKSKDLSSVFCPKFFAFSRAARQALSGLITKKDKTISINKEYDLHRLDKRETDLPTFAQGRRLQLMPNACIPTPRRENALHVRSMPIWAHEDAIMKSITHKRITVILGFVGIGKSTQIPQLIMENGVQCNKPVQILSCQPNRLAAITLSRTVAQEWGERLGLSVGYQARLESCLSLTDSILLFTTYDFFLSSLTAPSFSCLRKATHIILDDFHTEEARADLSLLTLLGVMRNFNFKLILLGRHMHLDDLMIYLEERGFNDVGVISMTNKLPGCPRIMFVEDLKECLNQVPAVQLKPIQPAILPPDPICQCCNLSKRNHITNSLIQAYLQDKDRDEAFNVFVDLVVRHYIDINERHTITGCTFLSAVCMRGKLDDVLLLLKMAADPYLRTYKGWNSWQLANIFQQNVTSRFIRSYLSSPHVNRKLVNRVRVFDAKLVVQVIYYLHMSTSHRETILVYVPSFDEIIMLKEILVCGKILPLPANTFTISFLHVNLPFGDEKLIFEDPTDDVRKIILSTNVADTIHVKDVVHVVDTGCVQEKVSNLKNSATWDFRNSISKEVADHRAGLRTYRLYDRNTYENMEEKTNSQVDFSTLQELCLFATSLLNKPSYIQAFFEDFRHLIPAQAVVRSTEELIQIGALDKFGKSTALGHYLSDFPLSPRLAKALIYAVILRCLDPVLTLVAILSSRDPFIIPEDSVREAELRAHKMELAQNTFSDHISMLQAFLKWEERRTANSVDEFNNWENFLYPGTFDMVYGIRADLLGQLRAFGFVRCKGTGTVKDVNVNSFNWSVVKAALIAAHYPNIMYINPKTWTMSNAEFHDVHFDPLSCIGRDEMNKSTLPSTWTIYDKVSQAGAIDFCKGCTLVSPMALMLFAGNPYDEIRVENPPVNVADGCGDKTMVLRISDCIQFKASRADVSLVKILREKFVAILEKVLREPGVQFNTNEQRDLNTLTLVLTTEDQASGFNQIEGIGKWPRFAGGNLLSVPARGFSTEQASSSEPKNEAVAGKMCQ